MKAIPTMPKPTTTTACLLSGGRGYWSDSSSGWWPLTGTLPACIPGEESAHDMADSGCRFAGECFPTPEIQKGSAQDVELKDGFGQEMNSGGEYWRMSGLVRRKSSHNCSLAEVNGELRQ